MAEGAARCYEWSVLRAVPRVERGETVNVGVLVYCQTADYLGCRVTSGLERVRTLDPAVDLVGLAAQLTAVAELCAGTGVGPLAARSTGERFRWLIAPRSTVLQPGPVHTGVTDEPAVTLDQLYVRMVQA